VLAFIELGGLNHTKTAMSEIIMAKIFFSFASQIIHWEERPASSHDIYNFSK